MQYIRPITDNTYDEYLRDESRYTGWAEAIAFPKDEAQVIEIMKTARQNRTPVTVQGARTGLTGAAVPQGGYILNMSKMNKVIGLAAIFSSGCSRDCSLLSSIKCWSKSPLTQEF